MKQMQKMLCVFLAALFVCGTATVLKAHTADAPLSVLVSTNKAAYDFNDTVKMHIQVSNQGSTACDNVRVILRSSDYVLPKNQSNEKSLGTLGINGTSAADFDLTVSKQFSGLRFWQKILLFFRYVFRPFTPIPSLLIAGDQYIHETQTVSQNGSQALVDVYVAYKTSGTSHTDTTSMTERIEGSPIASDETIPLPPSNVTYLRKYVRDILDSGSYTIEGEKKLEGYSFPVTTYASGDKIALKSKIGQAFAAEMEEMGIPSAIANLGEIRMIVTDMSTSAPHAYLCWPGGYYEEEIQNNGTASIESIVGSDLNIHILSDIPFDTLEYVGVQTYTGYAVESYTEPTDNLLYRFYFDSQGLSKVEKVDMSTNQTVEVTTIRITVGVLDKNVFKPTGIKTKLEDMEKLFEGTFS